MTRRSDEVRARNRRVLVWSLVVAAVLHVAFFLLWPSVRVEPMGPPDGERTVVKPPEGSPMHVQVTFGPPSIRDRDGTLVPEPEDRTLDADRVLLLPDECRILAEQGRPPASGRLHLRVYSTGHANVVSVVETTGHDCSDEVITAVAGALRYHWLPSERFPAPVELIQPVTLTRAEG